MSLLHSSIAFWRLSDEEKEEGEGRVLRWGRR